MLTDTLTRSPCCYHSQHTHLLGNKACWYRTFTHSRTISRHAYPVTESTYPAIVNATDSVNRVVYPVTRHACNTRLPAVTQLTHTLTRPLTRSTDLLTRLQGALVPNVDPFNGRLLDYRPRQRRHLPSNKDVLTGATDSVIGSALSGSLGVLTRSSVVLTSLQPRGTDTFT